MDFFIDLPIAGASGSYLPLTGGTLTGALSIQPGSGGGLTIGGATGTDNVYSITLGDSVLSFYDAGGLGTPTLNWVVGSGTPLTIAGNVLLAGSLSIGAGNSIIAGNSSAGFGSVSVNNYSGTVSSLPQLYATTDAAAVALPSMTTTQKNAMTGMPQGSLVLDNTLNKLSFYGTDNTWHTVTSV